MKVLVIDSGTTTSRVRLSDGENVLLSVSRKAGAKDVSVTGDNMVLKRALKEGVNEVLEKSNVRLDEIDAIVASGMITSNVGLVDIPHLTAPAGIDELANNLVERLFIDITNKPILFIRGIKTGFSEESRIVEKDIMRGEETEIFGYLNQFEQGNSIDTLFMHYGSHHKCILIENGKITQSRTSITGELMMTVSQDTILSSSLVPISDIVIDMDWVRMGLKASEESGFGRALFSTRILQVMEKKSKMEASNFYLGALLSLDLCIARELITQSTRNIVLYGKKLFPSIFEPVIKEMYPQLEVVTVSEEESDFLSARGAVKIYKQSLNMRR